MINNGHVSRYQLVLQDTTIREINTITLIGNDNDRAPEGNILAKPNITRDGQMIQLENVGNGAEPLLEVTNLFECVAEFDDGGLVEHAVRVHDKLAVLERVEVRCDQEQVRA
jgi:hypothetical protein